MQTIGQIKRLAIAGIFALFAVLVLSAPTAFAAESYTFDISKGSVTFDSDGKVSGTTTGDLTVTEEYYETVTITGTSDSNTITVSGDEHSFTLSDVSITTEMMAIASPITVSSGATANITLADGTTNSVKSTGIEPSTINAGINVPSGAALTISGDTGTLTAQGGNSGAGIGGGNGESAGTIKISGGTVTATGGSGGAGIGGGFSTGNDGTAIIYASSISDNTDTTSWSGIIYQGTSGQVYGGSDDSYTLTSDHTIPAGYTLTVPSGTTLTVNGGVTLNVSEGTFILEEGGSYAVTDGFIIAAGADLTYGTDFTYTSGVLTILSSAAMTVANLDQTDDGDGLPDNATTHTIVASATTANLTLNSVNIESSTSPIAVAAGSTLNLTLADGTKNSVTSTASNYAGINVPSGAALTISGDTGTLTVQGGAYAAGIGGGDGQSAGTITIIGGTVTATGGSFAAGIGGGDDGAGGNIKISGGTVTAKGGMLGAGIGGGYRGAGDTIEISGGVVYAYGGDNGAGIGGGWDGAGGEITISGGVVYAYGAAGGAGIGGGGDGGDGGEITISGGTVTATGSYGAGIGGGSSGAGGDVVISGGVVYAYGGTDAAGIGAGYGSSEHGSFTTTLTEDDGGDTITLTSSALSSTPSIVYLGGGVSAVSFTSGSISTLGGSASGVATMQLANSDGTGDAFIVASSIGDSDDTSDWSGVIITPDEDGAGTGWLYGSTSSSYSLSSDAVIPTGYTLTLTGTQTLTVAGDTDLTVDGNLIVVNPYDGTSASYTGGSITGATLKAGKTDSGTDSDSDSSSDSSTSVTVTTDVATPTSPATGDGGIVAWFVAWLCNLV